MSIQQTLVGFERNFAERASVLSRTISSDDVLSDDESTWLLLGAPFPMRSVRVYNRARSEIRLASEIVETIVQNEIQGELDGDTEFARDVSIGAMYTDDLPISGQRYSNIFIVVSFELNADIILRSDAHVSVEMYFGWRQRGASMRVANDWHLQVNVTNVGPWRRAVVEREVRSLLTTVTDGASPGDRLRDGLRVVFNRDGVRNWYVIPGDGAAHGQESNVVVRHDASFFVVE